MYLIDILEIILKKNWQVNSFLCQREANLRVCGWWTDFTDNMLSRLMRGRALPIEGKIEVNATRIVYCATFCFYF